MNAVADNPEANFTRFAMITGPQIRAARALLGWSMKTLAEKADVSPITIQRAETAPDVPNMKTQNLAAIQRTLEGAGVRFLAPGDTIDGGPGVRMR